MIMALGVIPFFVNYTVVMYVAFTTSTSAIFEALNLSLHAFYVKQIEHTLIIVDQNV